MAEEKSEKLRLCPLCKSFVKEGTEICPRCGANLSLVPEEPSKDTEKIPFGKEMKTALFMCPECGAFLSEDAKKCPVCNVEIEPEKEEEEEKKIAEEISKELDIGQGHDQMHQVRQRVHNEEDAVCEEEDRRAFGGT
jgi:RNA polymerase subunit RPABC4/transcription elongation factor Spt4